MLRRRHSCTAHCSSTLTAAPRRLVAARPLGVAVQPLALALARLAMSRRVLFGEALFQPSHQPLASTAQKRTGTTITGVVSAKRADATNHHKQHRAVTYMVS